MFLSARCTEIFESVDFGGHHRSVSSIRYLNVNYGHTIVSLLLISYDVG